MKKCNRARRTKKRKNAPRRNAGSKSKLLKNFTGVVRLNKDKTVSIIGTGKKANPGKGKTKLYQFWTDGGDENDIRAKSLSQAARIASKRISKRAWDDGAWGIVKGTEGQMGVPPR
jgi:hypothetical protein